ncbi:MAG: isoprenylcysteine carboxylmethyltransferase family protein [Treponema sp.]|jgi:protein-S-isoprenylcysteine O-methyltransferase Ste14|nr:isoprenylcysteine carboxylmethyltransferase family protein [Treponema sp.]
METIDILVLANLVTFYAMFLGRTVLLYKRGVKVWVIGTSAKKPLEIILENILFPVLIIWSVFVILTALHIKLPGILSRYLIGNERTKYVGIVLCFAGLVIFLFALISFGKAWRIGIDEKNSHELITSGMFKYSRNPIFLFMDLFFTGIMLVYPNIPCIAMAVGAIIGIHLQIKREEKFLEGKFGEQYREYKKQARRYL